LLDTPPAPVLAAEDPDALTPEQLAGEADVEDTETFLGPEVGEAMRSLEGILPEAFPADFDPHNIADEATRVGLLYEHIRAAQGIAETGGGLFPEEGPDVDPGYALAAKEWRGSFEARLRDLGAWDDLGGRPASVPPEVSAGIDVWHYSDPAARPSRAFQVMPEAGLMSDLGWNSAANNTLSPKTGEAGEDVGRRFSEAITTYQLAGNRSNPPRIRAEAYEARLAGLINKRVAPGGRVKLDEDFPEWDLVWPDNPEGPRSPALQEKLLKHPWRPSMGDVVRGKDPTGGEYDSQLSTEMAEEGSDVREAQEEDAKRFAGALTSLWISPEYQTFGEYLKTVAPQRARTLEELTAARQKGPNADPGIMPPLIVGLDWVDAVSPIFFKDPTRLLYGFAHSQVEWEAFTSMDRARRMEFMASVPKTDPRFPHWADLAASINDAEDLPGVMEKLKAEGSVTENGRLRWVDVDVKAEYEGLDERYQDARGDLSPFTQDETGRPKASLAIATLLPSTPGVPHADPYGMSGAVTPVNFEVFVDQNGRKVAGSSVSTPDGSVDTPGQIGYLDPTEIEGLIRTSKGYGTLAEKLLAAVGAQGLTREEVESGVWRRELQEKSWQEKAVRAIGFHKFYRDQLVSDVVAGGSPATLIANLGIDVARMRVQRVLSAAPVAPPEGVGRPQGAIDPAHYFLSELSSIENDMRFGDPPSPEEMNNPAVRQAVEMARNFASASAKHRKEHGTDEAVTSPMERFNEDHQSAIASNDLRTGLTAGEMALMLGASAPSMLLTGPKKMRTPAGVLTEQGDRLVKLQVKAVKQKAKAHIERLAERAMDAAEAAVRADAEGLLARTGAAIDDANVEKSVVAVRGKVASKWKFRVVDAGEAAEANAWLMAAKVNDEALKAGHIVDDIDLSRTVRLTDDGVEVLPMVTQDAALSRRKGGATYTWRARPQPDAALSAPSPRKAGPVARSRTQQALVDAFPSLGAEAPRLPRAAAKRAATGKDPDLAGPGFSEERASAQAARAIGLEVPEAAGELGVFFPASMADQAAAAMNRAVDQMEVSGRHSQKTLTAAATIKAGRRAIHALFDADLLAPIRSTKRLSLIAPIEWTRRIGGKGMPLGVKDPITGRLRPMRPSDVIGPAVFENFKWAQKQAVRGAQTGAHNVDQWIIRMMDGSESKLDREVASKFIEIQGDPLPGATMAEKILKILDSEIQKAVDVTPARAGQEARGSARQIINALKGVGKKWTAEQRQAQFKRAMDELQVWASEIGFNLDEHLRSVGLEADALFNDHLSIVAGEVLAKTGKTLDEAVDIFHDFLRGKKDADEWVTRVVESGDDGHDLVLMIQYRALKETPADLANIFTVEKGGPTEAYQRWLKTGTVMPEDGVLEARKTAMDAASSFVGEAATLERLYKAINEQYQPRSRVELETDLVDQLKGLGRGASPADVQHRRKIIAGIRQDAESPEHAEMVENLFDSLARTWAAQNNSTPERWWVEHHEGMQVGAAELPRRRLSYFLMQRDLTSSTGPGFFFYSNRDMASPGMSIPEAESAVLSRLQGQIRATAAEVFADYPKVNALSSENVIGLWTGDIENSIMIHAAGEDMDLRAMAGAVTIKLNQESTLFVRGVHPWEDFSTLRSRQKPKRDKDGKVIRKKNGRPETEDDPRAGWLLEITLPEGTSPAEGAALLKDFGLPGGTLVLGDGARSRPKVVFITHKGKEVAAAEAAVDKLLNKGLDVGYADSKVFFEFIDSKAGERYIKEASRGKKAAEKRIAKYRKEGEQHGREYEDWRGTLLGRGGGDPSTPSAEVRRPPEGASAKPGAPDPEAALAVTEAGKASPYSTNLGRLGLRDGVAFTLDDIIDVARGQDRPDVERALYRSFGADVVKGESDIKIYPLKERFGASFEEVDATINKWLKGIGWNYKIFGPDLKGGRIPVNFRDFNYDNKHVWIYQPGSANSFQDYAYTLAWRVTHEVAHARVEAASIAKFGGKGKRVGALGIDSKIPGTQIEAAPLSLADALKAVEWEDLAFKEQRKILEQDFGIKITDDDFAKEYQLNMADAVRRVLTGEFSSPDVLGIVPKAADPAEMLEAARRILTEASVEMGLPTSVTHTEAKALGHTRMSEPITSVLPPDATVDEVMGLLRKTHLITNAHVIRILGDQPAYLDAIIRHLAEIRDQVQNQAITPKQVAFAYGVTMGSMGAKGIQASTLQRKTGLHFGTEFMSRNDAGNLMVRPEDAVAAWFFTEEGLRAMKSLEQGVFDPALFEGMTAIRTAYGDDRLKRMGVMKPPGKRKDNRYSFANLQELTDAINGAQGNPKKISEIILQTRGISDGKVGFFQHILTGVGPATVDARELNVWFSGAGLSLKSVEAIRRRTTQIAKKWTSSDKVRKHVTRRIQSRIRALRKQGVGEGIPPEFFEAIIHHWIWDKVANTETPHMAIYSGRLDERLGPNVLPQRSKGGRIKGAAEHHASGRWTTHLLENSDVSTVIHELMHPVLDYLPKKSLKRLTSWAEKEANRLNKLAEKGKVPPELRHLWYDKKPTAKLEAVDADGVLTTDGQELGARAWERYVAEGVSPTRGLRETFDNLSDYMLAIYKSVDGSEINVRISDDVREFFDTMINFEKAEADEAVRRGELAQTVPRSMGKISPDELLNKSVANALDQLSEHAEVSRGILRQMTGYGTAAEKKAWDGLQKELGAALGKAKGLASKFGSDELSLELTVSEARQASRAAARLAQEGGDLISADWAALSPKVRASVKEARAFFDHFFQRLKAAGNLKGWSREEFFERMSLEGYFGHYFTKQGRKKINKLVEGKGTKHGGRVSDQFRSELQRKIPSFGEDVNRQYGLRIADELYESEKAAMGESYPWATPEQKQVRVQQIFREEKLDRVKFIETDWMHVLNDYGKEAEKKLANQKWFRHMRNMWPEGDEFAALAEKSILQADTIAAQSGFRAVDHVAHFRSLRGVDAHPAWQRLETEIETLMRSTDPDKIEVELFGLFERHGIDLTETLRKEARLYAKRLYLPLAMADLVEDFVRPDFMSVLRDSSNPLAQAFGQLGLGLDDFMNFWKSRVTVLFAAFHGRNYQSNIVANIMTHGIDGASPANQSLAISMMQAADDEIVRVPIRGKFGGMTEHSMTGAEWRREMDRLLVDTRTMSFADIETSARQMNLNQAAAMATSAVSTVAGGWYGYKGAEEEDKRWKEAMKYGFIGGMTGAAAKTSWDLFGSRPWKTLYRGGFSEKAWLGAWDQFMDDASESLRKSASVGASGAIMTNFLVPDFVGVSAWQGGASMAGMSLATEGLVGLGGAFGVQIERQARITNWIAGMRKGQSPESSADLVNRTLFNYDDLTYIEKNVIKRLFPFYTWTSKNALSLQPWLARERPERYYTWNRFLLTVGKDNLNELDMSMIPEEHRYRFVLATGMGKYIAGFGLHQESISELAKTGPFLSHKNAPIGLLGAMHPVVPFAIRMLGQDPYYVTETKNIRTARDVKHLYEGIQRFVGYKRMKNPRTGKEYDLVGYYPDGKGGYIEDAATGAYRLALLRAAPGWRIANEYNVLARDTFLPGATTVAEGEQATGEERAAKFIFGLKSYQYDVDDMDQQMFMKYERRLRDLALDRGIAKEALYISQWPLVAADDPEAPVEEAQFPGQGINTEPPAEGPLP
tara:strand:+ start:20082 stop:31013 length:10932 start_codon:yes stop_codon:yes gene_type:complete